MADTTIFFENFRRADGSLDLTEIARAVYPDFLPAPFPSENARTFFSNIESLHPITSRQVAALAITSFYSMFEIVLKQNAQQKYGEKIVVIDMEKVK